MPTLDATVGDAAANSYATVSDADTYFDERLQSSAWTDEDTDDKERALITASRRIDDLRFEGERDTEGQARSWPRIGAFDVDGIEFSASSTPEIVKQATYEYALHLLTSDDDGSDPLADTGLEGFKRAKVGPIEVEIDKRREAASPPRVVLNILDPVLRGRLSRRLIRS